MSDIEIVRSWPPEQWMLEDHPYVVDNARRVVINSKRKGGTYFTDYRPLYQVGQDMIHLDWDMAIGRDELRDFADRCRENPHKLRTMACRTYPTRRYQLGLDETKQTEWHAWHSLNPKVEVEPGDPYCKWFSFAAIYLPWSIWKPFVESFGDKRDIWCSARSLASWYHINVEDKIALDWETNIVHVNYSIKDALDLEY